MEHPKVSNADMEGRIVRFSKLKEQGIPLMFIDSVLPGHRRMNFAVIGDTASENPEFRPYITEPHKFQIGMVNAPTGSGPAYHTHDYVEMFIPLTGRWRYYWGNDPEGEPEGEAVLEPWDMISLPPGLWRGFENIAPENAWLLAVLDPHEVFTGKDPYWAPKVARAAAEHGFHADDSGKMVRPENYEQVRDEVRAELERGMR